MVPPPALPPSRHPAQHRIPVAGTHNLRDLGGYLALDGQTVRRGALYRSDHLGRLTRRGLKQLSHLGLVTVIDLRSNLEQEQMPDRLPAGAPLRLVALPILDASREATTELRDRIAQGDVGGLDVPALLRRVYRQFATEFTPEFRALVAEVLAAEGRPVLFHCTAGKDRTGFAAAILLRLLGAPQEAVLVDYELSTPNCLRLWRRTIWLLSLRYGRQVAHVVRQLCGAEREYLSAAFQAIDDTHGSFEAYVRDGLGLAEEDVMRLRAMLLERVVSRQ